MKLNSIIASVLSAACSFCVLTSLADHTASTADLGKEINVDGTLTVSSTIDLLGQNVTYKGVTDITGTGTFKDDTTDASKPGVLTLEIAKGASIANGKSPRMMTLSGNLRIVKTGEGTLSIADSSSNGIGTHSYTGGTEVRGGKLYTTKTAAMNGDVNTPFGYHPDISVYSGAMLDLNAAGHDMTTINLYGGTITTPGTKLSATKLQKAAINVYQEGSKIDVAKYFTVYGPVVLNNKVLSLASTANGTDLYVWAPSKIEGGTIYVEKGVWTLTNPVGSSTASLILNAGTKVAGNFAYTVKDFTIDATASIEGQVLVYGAYRLDANGNVCNKVVMQDGSTLDVSKVEGMVANITALQYADGVPTITIDVGERELAEGDMVVSWTTKPEGVTFGLKGSVIGDNQNFAVTDTGLVYAPKSDEIASLTWKGGSTGGWLDRANWFVKNGAGEEMNSVDAERLAAEAANLTATFSGDVSGLSFAGEFPFGGIEFLNAYLADNGDFTDIDWEKVVTTTPIDVKGKSLKISAAESSTPPDQVEITDSIGEGVVELTIPKGEIYRNEKMSFTGLVKIEKNGAGTFVGVLDLTNEGGFEVKEGKITPAAQGSLWANNVLQTPFGKGVITIDENGLLDPLGGYNWGGVTIELNGGMITNTVESLGVTSNRAAASRTNVFNPTLVLLMDSYFVTAESFNFQGTIVANEHKLNLSIASSKRFVWYPESAINLYLNVVNGGYLQTMRDPIPATATDGMTLEMNAAPRFLEDGEQYPGGMDVENYISKYTASASEGAAPLRVHGVFRPETAYFYGATMMDGSTIDLSKQGTSWNIKALKFENDATITLDLSQRDLREGTCYVSWGANPPENLSSLHFALDKATQSSGYTIKVEEDGIRAHKHVAYDLDVKNDTTMQEAINKFFNTTKNFDTSTTTINGWMETDAGNGYRLKDCLILGLEVVSKGKCATPYLKADASADVAEGEIKFEFGGINNPKTDKADIKFEIFTCGADGAWTAKPEVSGEYGVDTTATATLPEPEAGQSAVKYFKVHFDISEKVN